MDRAPEMDPVAWAGPPRSSADLGVRQKEDVVEVARAAVAGKPAGEPHLVLQIAKACGIDRSKSASVD